ncbi:hypothetical protein pipiens_011385 [Culex pipiens pipiens]|uniref:PWWP domain-containing protein n=1 Tax=Culex pipiens pipiens TaxID=38569 RepID=A0ABD1D6I8_CULPP
MFGRRIRTNLELLLPPPPKPPSEATELKGGSRKRRFEPHDLVYAKLYSGNKWHWAPGVVCDRVGQLLSRADWDPKTDGAEKPKLALDILLDSWNLSKPTSAADPTTPTVLDPSLQSASSDQRSSPGVPECSPSIPRSPEQVAPPESEPASLVLGLRRSTRVRKKPQRFNSYQLN